MTAPLVIASLQRPTSLVAEVCQRLSEVILAQKPEEDASWLPPERSLAEQLGVSRTVVREATKRLEQQGLLQIQHGTGIKIVHHLHRPLSDSLNLLIPEMRNRLRQLHQTRLAIEPEAAALAAEHATEDHLAAIRSASTKLAKAETSEEAIDADLEWHRALAEASGNQIFRLILDSLADLGRESRMRTIGRIGKTPAVEHHAAIQAAVEKGDPKAAAKAMRLHILAALRDMQLDPGSR